MRRMKTFAVLVVVMGVTLSASAVLARGRNFHPAQGRFVQRDPQGYVDGMNLYQYVRGNPVMRTDPDGTVTFEQVNAIARQMGLEVLQTAKGPATKLIEDIQAKLGLTGAEVDGDFGPKTVAAYEKWASANGIWVIPLRDARGPREVLDFIIEHWPDQHKCAKDCPVFYGDVLALVYYESMDFTTREPESTEPVYFNAYGGPYGSKGVRTTAVGLAQFTEATAPREIAYSAEASIKEMLQLLFKDAAAFSCNFEPTRNRRILQRGLNRWEAWRTRQPEILQRGNHINDLIMWYEQHGREVPENELWTALGGQRVPLP